MDDGHAVTVHLEEVLSALSLVLNGGSLEQLQVINKELIAALSGREDRIKDLLTQLDVFVGGLDRQKGQIVRALDSLDRLSTTLLDERDVIATALEDIPAGLAVLTDQRQELTEVLTSLDKLGKVAVRVIRNSQDKTVADLKALDPVLTQLNAAGTALPRSLELLTTYPFPRTVTEGIKGDFANLFVTLDLDLRDVARSQGAPLPSTPPLPVPVPTIAVPSLPPLPPLPGLSPPALPLPRTAPSPGGVLPRLPLDGGGLGLLQLLLGGLA